MFDQILVPLDGSPLAEYVLPHVITLAKANESSVLLLRVLDSQATGDPGEPGRPHPVDPLDWQIRKAEAETYLGRVAKHLEGSGLEVSFHLGEGRPAETIIDFAHSHQVGLIALSSHGASGMSGWNVSSVVQKIIFRARTSVMITRAYRRTQPEENEAEAAAGTNAAEDGYADTAYKRILVPLDGSQRAEVVLPLAAALARAQKAQIYLVHVVRQPEMPRRTPLSKEDQELSERLVERNRVEASKYLADLEARLEFPVETRLLIEPEITSTLHNLVEQESIDLVLMSAHGYTGGTQWPYGTKVISFVAYGTTPLIIVQDLPADRMEPTLAEVAAREHGGR